MTCPTCWGSSGNFSFENLEDDNAPFWMTVCSFCGTIIIVPNDTKFHSEEQMWKTLLEEVIKIRQALAIYAEQAIKERKKK